MSDSDVRERAGRVSHYSGGPAFDLAAVKLLRPPVRPGMVGRSSLIVPLARDDSRRIVSVVAPPGYGKTTLLSQWAERDARAFAWVSVDEQDNDPKVLLTYVAEALNTIEPIDERVFDALASPASSVPGVVLPRLGSALWSMSSPVVLVLDDVHILHNCECQTALSMLADHVPRGSQLALAGRGEPPVRIARLRARGQILEIGPGELSLTRQEADSLLRGAGVALGDNDVATLHRQTEGWPAGLYLAALYLREGGSLPRAAVSFRGRDRLVSEYLESELLAQVPPHHRVFLTRTAVLARMSGPLCEAVLELPGAAVTLADLARSNLLLVPLDRRGQWYRYHHLFRDVLLAELERREPGLMRVLRSRAAGWCLANSLSEEALGYSIAAGDVGMAARLVERLWLPTYRRGRFLTVQRWLRWLDDLGAIEARPVVTAAAALIYAWMGRPTEAERWAGVADRRQTGDAARPGDHAAEAWATLLRSFLCRDGIEQMLADAQEARRRFEAENIVTPGPALLEGLARILGGDTEGSAAALEDAVRLGEGIGAHEVSAAALSEQSLRAMAGGEWNQAEVLARKAGAVLRKGRIEESYVTPLVCAAQARAALHRGNAAAASDELIRAQRTRPLLTYAVPHIAVQARVELIRAYLALGDLGGARTLIREIDELLRRRPALGTLTGEAQALRTRLTAERGTGTVGPSALTGAELRLLPLLATHMTLPQIARELCLSPYTIKSQAISIYRRLDVSMRTEAVARARELGLLDRLEAAPVSQLPHPGVASWSGGVRPVVVLTLTTSMPRSNSRLSRPWSSGRSASVPRSSV